MNTLPEVIDQTVTSSDCRGWTWSLPMGALCARRARTLIADTFEALEVLPQTLGDAELMVSELATNAYRHAGPHGPHELWLFPRADVHGPAPISDTGELVCAVFDSLPDLGTLADNAFCGDFGRGLSIVAELARGRWGVQPAVSHLVPDITGKAVWFACPVSSTVLRRIGRWCETAGLASG